MSFRVRATIPEFRMVPSFIEVFCGHAGLSLQMDAEGFKSLGIDHAHNKDKPVADHVFLDLAVACP